MEIGAAGVHSQSLLSRFLQDSEDTDEVQERADHNPAGVVRREVTTVGLGDFHGSGKLWLHQGGKTAELIK